MMIYGYASNERQGTNVNHAYTCILRNGKGLLIDFTNPIYKNGEFSKTAIYPISKEVLKSFIDGKGKIEVEHKDIYQKNGMEKEMITRWVYSSDRIDPKYFEKKSEATKLGQETQAEQEDTTAKDKTSQDMSEQIQTLDNKKENSLN